MSASTALFWAIVLYGAPVALAGGLLLYLRLRRRR